MSKSQILVTASLGVMAGVLLGSVTTVPFVLVALAGVISVSWLVLASIKVQVPYADQKIDHVASKRFAHFLPYASFVFLPWFMLAASLGVWRMQKALSVENEFVSWIGEKQDFEAVIMSEPDVRQDKQLLAVVPRGHNQHILVTTTLGKTYFYGDLVWVRGKVTEPKAFSDFDYPAYLARFNTFALMSYPKVITLEGGHGNVLVRHMLQVKILASEKLLKLYKTDDANLLLGILIGARRGISKDVSGYFSRTGTSHIVAVSGFNISIFIGMLGVVAYVVGRRWQLVLSFVLVVLFVVMAGPSSSVLRAAGMGMLVMLATASGRLYNPLPSLAFVCSLMVLVNPRILYWDIGFQLSATATAGIVLGMSLLEQCKILFGGWYKVVQLLAVTMFAIFATLPLTLWHFGQASVVAPLANMIIVPPVPVTMLFGALSFLPILGSGFAFVNSLLLETLVFFARHLAEPTWATFQISISALDALGLYILLFCGYMSLTVLASKYLAKLGEKK